MIGISVLKTDIVTINIPKLPEISFSVEISSFKRLGYDRRVFLSLKCIHVVTVVVGSSV